MQTTIKLESSDERVFEVDKDIAQMSATIKHMLSDLDADSDTPIPLPNVKGSILQLVIDYCTYHHSLQNDAKTDTVPTDTSSAGSTSTNTTGSDTKSNPLNSTDNMTPWDKKFCDVDQSTLFELILAANYLDIKDLLDVTCTSVANMLKGKTPDEIRSMFNIKNDFTPEEEEQIRKENEWCMDL